MRSYAVHAVHTVQKIRQNQPKRPFWALLAHFLKKDWNLIEKGGGVYRRGESQFTPATPKLPDFCLKMRDFQKNFRFPENGR